MPFLPLDKRLFLMTDQQRVFLDFKITSRAWGSSYFPTAIAAYLVYPIVIEDRQVFTPRGLVDESVRSALRAAGSTG